MPPYQPNTFSGPSDQDQGHATSINAMMREVLHRLGNIDVEHEIALDRLDSSDTDQELKLHIKRKIWAAHRERREPYVELLTTLRQRQHRLSHLS